MNTLFLTARTSLYAGRMNIAAHRFAWNPISYEQFQTKCFGTANAPNSAFADAPAFVTLAFACQLR
jgi:hypothetical protein